MGGKGRGAGCLRGCRFAGRRRSYHRSAHAAPSPPARRRARRRRDARGVLGSSRSAPLGVVDRRPDAASADATAPATTLAPVTVAAAGPDDSRRLDRHAAPPSSPATAPRWPPRPSADIRHRTTRRDVDGDGADGPAGHATWSATSGTSGSPSAAGGGVDVPLASAGDGTVQRARRHRHRRQEGRRGARGRRQRRCRDARRDAPLPRLHARPHPRPGRATRRVPGRRHRHDGQRPALPAAWRRRAAGHEQRRQHASPPTDITLQLEGDRFVEVSRTARHGRRDAPTATIPRLPRSSTAASSSSED